MTAQITPGSSRDGAPLVPNLGKSTTHPISADRYADRLMDDLFDELESSLDEGVDIPLATEEMVPADKEEEPLSLTPLQVSSVVLPPQVLPTGPKVERQERERAIADAVRAEERDRSENKNFDRFVIGAALFSLVASMGLWAWNQRNQQAALMAAQQSEATTQTTAGSGNSEFVGYMQRSLSAIDAAKPEESETAVVPVPVDSVPVLPEGAPVGDVGQNPPFTSNLVEAIDRLSRILENMPVDSEGRPLPSFQVIPGTEQAAAPKAEEKPAADDQATSADAGGEASEASPIIPQYSLVGLLELGDRSVALFSIDGVTRRVAIGEAVGGSGWVLAEVESQEAKIKKDGKVKSLFIGQKF